MKYRQRFDETERYNPDRCEGIKNTMRINMNKRQMESGLL